MRPMTTPAGRAEIDRAMAASRSLRYARFLGVAVLIVAALCLVGFVPTRRLAGDEAVARIRELRAADGGDLVVMGSASLVRMLLTEGLVDELRLNIEPVILGGGKSIFPDDGGLRTLELVATATSGTGVHLATYRPVAGA